MKRRMDILLLLGAVTIGLIMTGGCGSWQEEEIQKSLMQSGYESIWNDQTQKTQPDLETVEKNASDSTTKQEVEVTEIIESDSMVNLKLDVEVPEETDASLQAKTSAMLNAESSSEVKEDPDAAVKQELDAEVKEDLDTAVKQELGATVKEEPDAAGKRELGPIENSDSDSANAPDQMQVENEQVQEEVEAEPEEENGIQDTFAQETVHQFVVERIEATCTADGYTKRYCSLCQEVASETILPCKGHVITENWWWQPTCTATGYKNVLCSVCGYVDTEKSGTVERLPHTIVEAVVQQGNCMSDTIIQQKCTVCQEIIEEDRYTEYNKHCWSSNEEGTYCDWCGISK